MDKVVFDLVRLVCVQENAYMGAFGVKSSGLIWVQKNQQLGHHVVAVVGAVLR